MNATAVSAESIAPPADSTAAEPRTDRSSQAAAEDLHSIGKPNPPLDYFVWIDCLRLAAIVEIVAFHVLDRERIPVIGGLGLPVFLAISSSMSVVVARRRSPQSLITVKVRKLGPAWLFWCAIYGIELAVRYALGRRVAQPPELAMLLYGPSIHLWFVPFSIVAALIASMIIRPMQFWNASAITAMTAISTAGLAFAGASAYGAGPPFDQWCFAAASIPLGILAGLMLSESGKRRLALAFGLTMAILIGLAAAAIVDGPAGPNLRRLSLGTALVAAAGLIPGRGMTFTKKAIPGVMGVYFVHVLIQKGLHRWLSPSPLAFFAVVLGLSAIAVVLLSRTRLRPFVVSR